MKYITSLSKLTSITDIKIIKTISVADKLNQKINELENQRRQLQQEVATQKEFLQKLIHTGVSGMPEYYKLRSEIAALSGRLLLMETRITTIADDIKEVSQELSKVYDELSYFKRKKKKYEKIITEGL